MQHPSSLADRKPRPRSRRGSQAQANWHRRRLRCSCLRRRCPPARAVALALIAKMGLRGIDAGPICNSAAAEALTSILIFLNRKHKVAGSGIRITGLDDAAVSR